MFVLFKIEKKKVSFDFQSFIYYLQTLVATVKHHKKTENLHFNIAGKGKGAIDSVKDALNHVMGKSSFGKSEVRMQKQASSINFCFHSILSQISCFFFIQFCLKNLPFSIPFCLKKLPFSIQFCLKNLHFFIQFCVKKVVFFYSVLSKKKKSCLFLIHFVCETCIFLFDFVLKLFLSNCTI